MAVGVALAAGVGGGAPGAAAIVSRLQDDEVFATGGAQLHGRAHTCETGTDDDDVLGDHISDTIGIWTTCKGVSGHTGPGGRSRR